MSTNSKKMFFKRAAKPICPYCNSILEDFKYRSKKCPSCKNKIHVIIDNEIESKVLLKEEDVLHQKHINMYFESFGYLIKKKELIKKRDKWFKKFPKSTYGDLIHSTYQELLFEKSKLISLSEMSGLYRGNAQFLEFEGKPYKHLLREANKCFLKGSEAQQELNIKVSWLCHPDACEACKREQEFKTYDKAIKDNNWPPEDCTCGPLESFGSTFIYDVD